jgi:hypothetical protein
MRSIADSPMGHKKSPAVRRLTTKRLSECEADQVGQSINVGRDIFRTL